MIHPMRLAILACFALTASAATTFKPQEIGTGLSVVYALTTADVNNDKKAWGERFGMTHFVNPKEVDGSVVPHIVNMTKTKADQIGGADYSFDCTGNVKVMRDALECTHRGWGVSVVIGVVGAGLSTTVQPAASAGPIFQIAIISG